MKEKTWTMEEVLAMAGSYQSASVLTAAVALDLFTALAEKPAAAESLAAGLGTDTRATAILLDALTAMGFLKKQDNTYAVVPSAAKLLAGAGSALAMVRHQANCLERWARLAEVVKNGRPAEGIEGILGNADNLAAFIGAMHDISEPVAAKLIAELGPPDFSRLLDVGGASGTWTIAFLEAAPKAAATLFDLPDVIPLAKKRLADAGMAERVRLVAGDYNTDALPRGADLAWVSAIVHQNSRPQNRALFAKVLAALGNGGCTMIRDGRDAHPAARRGHVRH
ncbi:MAG: methyltransferase [Phycisphaerae bacterium]|jgi:hypothetical protein|nr:methyltransferase [Phycisphaerae bacterium]